MSIYPQIVDQLQHRSQFNKSKMHYFWPAYFYMSEREREQKREREICKDATKCMFSLITMNVKTTNFAIKTEARTFIFNNIQYSTNCNNYLLYAYRARYIDILKGRSVIVVNIVYSCSSGESSYKQFSP